MRIDFHRHLEGSHTARALRAVAQQFHIGEFLGGMPPLDMQGPPGDTAAFYAAIEVARRAYVSPEAVAALAYETFLDCAADVDALEMRVSLFSMTRTLIGKSWRDAAPTAFAERAAHVLSLVLAARDRAEKETNKRLLVRLGLSRTFESEPHYMALADAVKDHARALCGIDVLGILPGPDKEPLQDGLVRTIDKLRPLLPDLTIHAGELDDHTSVDRALELSPRGIGHGVRSLGSDATLARLQKDGVTLEVCPSSNALLIPDVVAALEQRRGKHPVCALQACGVHTVLGSDDPVPMRTTFQSEWALAEKLGVDRKRLAEDSTRRWRELTA